jgi:hypothetical protein
MHGFFTSVSFPPLFAILSDGVMLQVNLTCSEERWAASTLLASKAE